jgi:hypothetical protein
MPRPKRILSGDEYITKTEKMIGLPKKYPNLSKTEKMRYLPRFYYNNHEKIDDGFLDYIPINNYVYTLVELNLRPNTNFGYPTWGSVFGGYDFIQSNYIANNFLINDNFNNEMIFYYNWDFNLDISNNGGRYYIDDFIPFGGSFFSFDEGFNTEYQDNARFANSYIPSPFPKYMLLFFQGSTYLPYRNQKIQLFNNNRAKVVLTSVPI